MPAVAASIIHGGYAVVRLKRGVHWRGRRRLAFHGMHGALVVLRQADALAMIEARQAKLPGDVDTAHLRAACAASRD